jgi:hypothetical protein
MRRNLHNPKFAAQTFIDNGWDYFHGANGADDGQDDADKAAADAAAAAAQAAADAKARGDVIEEPEDEAAKAAAVAEAAQKAADEAEAAKKAEEAAKKTADENSEEEDETEEERAEREAAEAEEARKKKARIPLSRHEEILAKAREREEALAARLLELENKQKGEPKKDVLGEMRAKIDELQDKYEELVFEGEKDKAKAVRKELDAARERYTDTKVAQSGALARAQTIETLKYEQALAKAEADYPALNPDNADAFDDAKANEVAELMEMFIRSGLTRQAGLEKAVKYVMGSPAQKKDASKDTAAETLRLRREQEARQKAADALKKQPPDSGKTGADNDKAGGQREQGINILKVNQDQFDKFDEDTLAKLRGDVMA